MNSVLARSGLVLIDKPVDFTSHDVVARIRRALHTRKVGHAGTLDPLATGLLILGIERGTKFLAHMTKATKAYDTTIRLGATTTTDDAAGEIISTADTFSITDEQILTVIQDSLTGDIMQRPSSVSAIKVDGKRAYARVRAGEEVTLPARPVTIDSFEVTGITRHDEGIDITASIDCSSGTYIRAIGRDLGELLGCGGHLQSLRRTRIADFLLADAMTLDEFEANPQLNMDLDTALIRSYPRLDVTAQQASDLSEGKWLVPQGLKGQHVAVDPTGHAIAIVAEKGKRLSTVFVARPKTMQ
ncbi:MAG: tRNA pseudouridine(55) synthase TruB [Corynebacterium sp.]|nr:tRNA pseudouridine(55) synthase TruB [Corynebacterium sp.]